MVKNNNKMDIKRCIHDLHVYKLFVCFIRNLRRQSFCIIQNSKNKIFENM